MSAFSKVVSQTSTSWLTAKQLIAMDATLILPPEAGHGARKVVAWAGHARWTLLTRISLPIGLDVIQEELRRTLAIGFGSAILSR